MFIASPLISIPSNWIIENYLGISNVNGRRIVIKSPFSNERTPSCYITIHPVTKEYCYKCFSSGNGGNVFQLVAAILKINENDFRALAAKEYDVYLKSGKKPTPLDLEVIKEAQAKFVIIDYKTREFQKHDIEYWLQYGIKEETLVKYNVKALQQVVMKRNKSYGSIQYIHGKYLYGYFNAKGIDKVYKPNIDNIQTKMFFNFGNSSYIQGEEQIKNSDNLIITSSLKDIMCLDSLNIDADIIAAISETTIIPESKLNSISKASRKIVFLNSDEPGIKASRKYNYPKCYVQPEKDPSDYIKNRKNDGVLNILIRLIRTFEKYDVGLQQ